MDWKQYALLAIGILLLSSALPTIIAWFKTKVPSTATTATPSDSATVLATYEDQAKVLANLTNAETLLRKHGDVANADKLVAMLPTVRPWGWIPAEAAK